MRGWGEEGGRGLLENALVLFFVGKMKIVYSFERLPNTGSKRFSFLYSIHMYPASKLVKASITLS